VAKRLVAIAALTGMVLVTSSCSNTRAVGRNGTIDVALTEYRLDPQRVSTNSRQLTIVVHNYGRMTHNFVVRRGGKPAGGTKPIWPGRSATLTLTLAPGTYVMASTILSDQALGTYGTLVVR
jgi:hypothetical protein